MKYIGIDYGTKRIGLAVSDDGGTLAFPLTTVPAGRDALSKIDALIKENGVQKIIIGESRDFAGQPNAVMEEIDRFKKALEELTQLPVEYERELFTSAQAARQFAPEAKSPSGVGRPRASRKANPSHDKLDAAAAALILQSFLDRMKGNGN